MECSRRTSSTMLRSFVQRCATSGAGDCARYPAVTCTPRCDLCDGQECLQHNSEAATIPSGICCASSASNISMLTGLYSQATNPGCCHLCRPRWTRQTVFEERKRLKRLRPHELENGNILFNWLR